MRTIGALELSEMSFIVSVTIVTRAGLVADVAVERHLLQVVDEDDRGLPGPSVIAETTRADLVGGGVLADSCSCRRPA